ncbi:MAG: hypothetical protein IJJ33_08750 [Victivallales bacterium]|nr:hypothetical protein [Victivallales bacterium]MBQ6472059.1 hypothetical protein [Victivallales bacterium]
MGVASLVIGIIAVILGFIPCVGQFAFIPAVLGIILGAVGIASAKKNNQPKGTAVAGLVLNIIAVAVIVAWNLLFAAAAAAVDA